MGRGLLASLLVPAIVAVAAAANAAPATQPNILFVLFDDLGWMDVGAQGNGFIETPHIDRLAREGVRFSNFYAANPVCSPTRASIQSGQNPARFGLTDFIPGYRRPFERVTTPTTAQRLPRDIVTLGDALRAAGYRTGYFGKWHLGDAPEDQPGVRGYDVTAEAPFVHRTSTGQWGTDVVAERVAAFVSQADPRPFFAFVSPYEPHIPLLAPAPLVTKYERKAQTLATTIDPIYAAMVEQGDAMIGRILATLEQQGVADRTVVVFTSDNGGLVHTDLGLDTPVTTNAPLRGEKGTLHEGGLRVPMIVRMPGSTARGITTAQVGFSYDFYPTLLELAGGALRVGQPSDGISLASAWRGSRRTQPRAPAFFYYPHYHHGVPSNAVLDGDWKLIEYFDGRDTELYNLQRDIGEQHNLAAREPAQRVRLERLLAQWRKTTAVAVPARNADFDAARAGEWWDVRSNQPVDMAGFRRFFTRPSALPAE